MCAYPRSEVIVWYSSRLSCIDNSIAVRWVFLQIHVLDAVCCGHPGRSDDKHDTDAIVDLKIRIM